MDLHSQFVFYLVLNLVCYCELDACMFKVLFQLDNLELAECTVTEIITTWHQHIIYLIFTLCLCKSSSKLILVISK